MDSDQGPGNCLLSSTPAQGAVTGARTHHQVAPNHSRIPASFGRLCRGPWNPLHTHFYLHTGVTRVILLNSQECHILHNLKIL